MRILTTLLGTALLGGASALAAPTTTPAEPASRIDEVLDAVVANEREVADTLERYRPLVETYIQTVKPDPILGTVPVKDSYFFGRLELPQDGAKGGKRKSGKSLSLFDDFHSQTIKPESFARMLVVDHGAFDRQTYDFELLRAEFLGEVRTLVFDVQPKSGKALGRLRAGSFIGRIWVEDRDYAIVRFNGIYASSLYAGFHFDSWRLHVGPDLWLPAYVYTEEPERTAKQLALTHKGQTRIWGYDMRGAGLEDEFTKVLVDASFTRDPSDRPGQISPIESARAWESEAEINVLGRLERAGLLAPPGDVDGVLDTVVANLEITNSLSIEPPVRCRVLLTTPLESFTIGHTIVISRGLIDVLPDEASLAMVLAHELGHVLAGHRLDTTYAFSDRVLAGDRETVQQFLFERDATEERQADERAVELLRNSPYKDDLATAGLFLKSLTAHAGQVPSLIRPHFGNALAGAQRLQWMAPIVDGAPALDPASIEQTAALPLGGRVKLDPWSARIELMQNSRVALLSAREKMAFQVTPLMPYLARGEASGEPPVAEARRERSGSGAAGGGGSH